MLRAYIKSMLRAVSDKKLCFERRKLKSCWELH